MTLTRFRRRWGFNSEIYSFQQVRFPQAMADKRNGIWDSEKYQFVVFSGDRQFLGWWF